MKKQNGQGKADTTPAFGTTVQDNEQPIGGGGPLPGEVPDGLEFGGYVEDETLFVALKEPGQTFMGKFLRKVDKGGDEGMKYPGFLFAEYPSGGLRVVQANWSIGEMIAKAEEEGVNVGRGTAHVVPFSDAVVEITLKEVKAKKDDTSVKLFAYRFAKCPEAFDGRILWNDTFQRIPERAGK